jgi:hypothetical protein
VIGCSELGSNEFLLTNDLFGVQTKVGENPIRGSFDGRLVAYPKKAFDDPNQPATSPLSFQIFVHDLINGTEAKFTTFDQAAQLGEALDPYFDPMDPRYLYYAQKKTNPLINRFHIFRVIFNNP